MNATVASQLFAASVLGTIAFNTGRACVPAHDAELMSMLEGRRIGQTPEGEASTVAILDAWLKSWNAAHVARQLDATEYTSIDGAVFNEPRLSAAQWAAQQVTA